MYAKTSRAGLRFFAHAPGAPICALSLESVAHHLLKLELAGATRDAGAHAELEVRGPDGTWRADVLASDPAGDWKMALEAQLAPITEADLSARTERMCADCVTSIWFSDRLRPPWLGTVPSVRLAAADSNGGGLLVAEGLVKFNGRGWGAAPQVTIADFLGWVFAGKVIPHAPRTALRYPLRPLPRIWTAPQYIAAEDAHLVDKECRRRIQEARMAAARQAREKKRERIRAENAISRAKALEQATAVERAARTDRAGTGRMRELAIGYRLGIDQPLALLASEYGVTATVGWSAGDPRYEDSQRRVLRRAERPDRPRSRAVPRPVPGVRRRVQAAMATDQKHPHQPDEQPQAVEPPGRSANPRPVAPRLSEPALVEGDCHDVGTSHPHQAPLTLRNYVRLA